MPTIAAASDLKFALEEVAKAYEQTSGQKLRFVFGASGNLTRQIAQGAPFDLFLSADEQYVFDLHKQGLTVDEGVLYAIGHVVLFVPKGSPIKVDAKLEDLKRAIDDGRLKKLSIANPEHAPYGRAARAVLQSAGLWDKVQDKLVLGENVSQAAQYAASGATQAGLFALSLAVTPNYRQAGSYVVLPEAWHPPLRQRMVLLKRAGEGARSFKTYLQQPAARGILKTYGFALPGE
ncbi:MAG TPA: molybdate ABC transporter substrate-binding protein [Burkholderiales bacterium]